MSDQKVVIVAGEASGDLHAANLVRELLELDASIQLTGMGGEKMREAGVELLIDASDLAVIGIVEVLMNYRKIKKALDQLKQHINETKPDLLILVDYQVFNQKLAAFAKSLGVKVLFYIGPTVWAWKPKRVYKMAKIVDQLAVILPFEVEYYKDTNLKVTFTGHPLVDEVKSTLDSRQARNLLSLTDATTVVGLFPGSRKNEIRLILPVLLEAASIVKKELPNTKFVLPLANTLELKDLESFISEKSELEVTIIPGSIYEIILACDAIMAASGTVTLEIGLLGTPMAVVYKISALSHFILKQLVHVKHIGLVNILTGREVVHEFIQNDARPSLIALEILKILNNNNYNKNMRMELSQLNELLSGGGSKNVAKLAYDMLHQET